MAVIAAEGVVGNRPFMATAAALAVVLLEEGIWLEAGAWARAVAPLKATKLVMRAGLPTRDALSAYLAQRATRR